MKWLINFSALKSRRLVKPLPQLWREILNLWHWHQNKFWLVRSTSFRMNPWWVTRYVSECSLKERLFQWRGLHASKLSVSEECSIEWTSVAWRGCVWYKGSESNWTTLLKKSWMKEEGLTETILTLPPELICWASAANGLSEGASPVKDLHIIIPQFVMAVKFVWSSCYHVCYLPRCYVDWVSDDRLDLQVVNLVWILLPLCQSKAKGSWLPLLLIVPIQMS